jgi:alpha-ribazole phosphatase
MRIYVVRHGRARHNDDGRWNDDPAVHVPLTELGIQQAHEAAETLKDAEFDIVFASQLQRTQETAQIINKHHDAPMIVDKRLNEQKAGGGVNTYREFLERTRHDRFNAALEGGESRQDLKRRLHEFLDELKMKPYKSVLIVSHGDPIQVINGYFHKLADEELVLVDVKNCQIFMFDI